MTVMVDELRDWSGGRKVSRCFRRGSCHMTTDGDLAELHAIAERIGMNREWFQSTGVPHYDLTERRRSAALAEGALFVPSREQARVRFAKRRQDCLRGSKR